MTKTRNIRKIRIGDEFLFLGESNKLYKILDIYVASVNINPEVRVKYSFKTIDGKEGEEENTLHFFLNYIFNKYTVC